MKASVWLLTLGIVSIAFLNSPCNAEERDQHIEAVLASWQEASKACRTFDATFTATSYSTFEPTRILEGRFYYEAPDAGRIEYRPKPDADVRGAFGGSEGIVWTGDRIFVIDHQRKHCLSISVAEAQLARKRAEMMPGRTLWQRLQKGLGRMGAWPGWIATPNDVLPLFLLTDALVQRKRYDFSARRDNGHIFVKATPKRTDEGIREINVMLDARSYRLRAHQSITDSAEMVLVFDDVRFNVPPADRENLMKPIPQGYRELRLDEPSRP